MYRFISVLSLYPLFFVIFYLIIIYIMLLFYLYIAIITPYHHLLNFKINSIDRSLKTVKWNYNERQQILQLRRELQVEKYLEIIKYNYSNNAQE